MSKTRKFSSITSDHIKTNIKTLLEMNTDDFNEFKENKFYDHYIKDIKFYSEYMNSEYVDDYFKNTIYENNLLYTGYSSLDDTSKNIPLLKEMLKSIIDNNEIVELKSNTSFRNFVLFDESKNSSMTQEEYLTRAERLYDIINDAFPDSKKIHSFLNEDIIDLNTPIFLSTEGSEKLYLYAMNFDKDISFAEQRKNESKIINLEKLIDIFNNSDSYRHFEVSKELRDSFKFEEDGAFKTPCNHVLREVYGHIMSNIVNNPDIQHKFVNNEDYVKLIESMNSYYFSQHKYNLPPNIAESIKPNFVSNVFDKFNSIYGSEKKEEEFSKIHQLQLAYFDNLDEYDFYKKNNINSYTIPDYLKTNFNFKNIVTNEKFKGVHLMNEDFINQYQNIKNKEDKSKYLNNFENFINDRLKVVDFLNHKSIELIDLFLKECKKKFNGEYDVITEFYEEILPKSIDTLCPVLYEMTCSASELAIENKDEELLQICSHAFKNMSKNDDVIRLNDKIKECNQFLEKIGYEHKRHNKMKLLNYNESHSPKSHLSTMLKINDFKNQFHSKAIGIEEKNNLTIDIDNEKYSTNYSHKSKNEDGLIDSLNYVNDLIKQNPSFFEEHKLLTMENLQSTLVNYFFIDTNNHYRNKTAFNTHMEKQFPLIEAFYNQSNALRQLVKDDSLAINIMLSNIFNYEECGEKTISQLMTKIKDQAEKEQDVNIYIGAVAALIQDRVNKNKPITTSMTKKLLSNFLSMDTSDILIKTDEYIRSRKTQNTSLFDRDIHQYLTVDGTDLLMEAKEKKMGSRIMEEEKNIIIDEHDFM